MHVVLGIISTSLNNSLFFQGVEGEVTKLRMQVEQLEERLRLSEEGKAALEQENRGLQEQVVVEMGRTMCKLEPFSGEKRREGVSRGGEGGGHRVPA